MLIRGALEFGKWHVSIIMNCMTGATTELIMEAITVLVESTKQKKPKGTHLFRLPPI